MGCATTAPPPQELDGGVTLRGIDFREYSEQGFLFTTRPPSGNYESKGILNVTLYPIIERVSESEFDNIGSRETVTKTIDGEETEFNVESIRISRRDNTYTAYYIIEVLDLDEAIQQMYREASAYGADALTELDISRESRNNNGLVFEVIEVSGFAIKRLPQDIKIRNN